MDLASELAAQHRRRGELLCQVRDVQAAVERLAARIEGIVRTHEQMRALAAYQPPIREDGSRYDAAAGARLAEAVRRRVGIER